MLALPQAQGAQIHAVPTPQSATGPHTGAGRLACRPVIPRPLKVLAIIAVGWCLAWPKALHNSSTLCPSTMMACQLGTEMAQGEGQPDAGAP
jgi:hypothetical protein